MFKTADQHSPRLAEMAVQGLLLGLAGCAASAEPPRNEEVDVAKPSSADSAPGEHTSGAAHSTTDPTSPAEPRVRHVAKGDGPLVVADTDKQCCKGKNQCKGLGQCKVDGQHDCKGKNDCKGMGGCQSKECVGEVAAPKNCCKGTNDCKGKGNCKTVGAQCKGLNACKGKGGCKSADCH